MSTFERLGPPEADDLVRQISGGVLVEHSSGEIHKNPELDPEAIIWRERREYWETIGRSRVGKLTILSSVKIAEVSSCPEITQRVEEAADQLYERFYNFFAQDNVTPISSSIESVSAADNAENDEPFRAYFHLEDPFHVTLHERFLRDVGVKQYDPLDDAYYQGDKIVLFDDPDNPSIVLKRTVLSHDGIPYGIQYNAERLGDTGAHDYRLDQEAV
jgi:hypothetical protein